MSGDVTNALSHLVAERNKLRAHLRALKAHYRGRVVIRSRHEEEQRTRDALYAEVYAKLIPVIEHIAQLRLLRVTSQAPRSDRPEPPSVPEFVYAHLWFWYERTSGEWRTSKHLILRKTKRRIFIDRNRWSEWRTTVALFGQEGACYALDREALERGETVKSAGMEWTLDPYPPPTREHYRRKPSGAFTGCETATDVKRVFRREVKRAHPDVGGSADSFRTLRAAYVQALAYIGVAP